MNKGNILGIMLLMFCTSYNIEASKLKSAKYFGIVGRKASHVIKSKNDLSDVISSLPVLFERVDIYGAYKATKYICAKTNSTKYLLLKGWVLFIMGEFNLKPNTTYYYRAALNIANKLLAISKKPQFILLKASALGRIGQFNRKAGGLFSGLGDLREANSLLKEAYKMSPGDVNIATARAQALIQAPGILGGDKNEGKNMLFSLLKRHPKSLRVNYAIARYYYDKKNKKALDYYNKCRAILKDKQTPRNPFYSYVKAFVPLQIARVYKSILARNDIYKLVIRHLSYAPNSPLGYSYLGKYYRDKGDYRKAIEAFKKAVYLDKNDDGYQDLLEDVEDRLDD